MNSERHLSENLDAFFLLNVVFFIGDRTIKERNL